MAAAFVSQRRRQGLTLVKPQPWTARMKEGKFGLGKKSGRTFFEKLSVSGMRKLSPFGVKWTHSCSESLASMLPRRARRQRQGAPIRAPSMRGTYSYNFSMKLAGCRRVRSRRVRGGGGASGLAARRGRAGLARQEHGAREIRLARSRAVLTRLRRAWRDGRDGQRTGALVARCRSAADRARCWRRRADAELWTLAHCTGGRCTRRKRARGACCGGGEGGECGECGGPTVRRVTGSTQQGAQPARCLTDADRSLSKPSTLEASCAFITNRRVLKVDRSRSGAAGITPTDARWCWSPSVRKPSTVPLTSQEQQGGEDKRRCCGRGASRRGA